MSSASKHRAIRCTDRSSLEAVLTSVRERRRRELARTERLIDFIPRMTPNYSRPVHLSRYVELLEQCGEGNVRVICNVPPRHGKTETIIHAIAWILRRRPELTIGYATYGQKLATSKSDKARRLSLRCGVNLSDTVARLDEWRTTAGGGVLAAGVKGGWTGHGIDVLVIDDPFKNRLEAESKLIRDRIREFFQDAALTRLEPNASVVINHTRWQVDDLSGWLIKEAEKGGENYEQLVYQAIDDVTGEALWPERYNRQALDRIRVAVGPYTWDSLYRNNPRPRGATLFEGAAYYDRLPSGPHRVGIGVDLAFSEDTKADYSTIVVMFEFLEKPGFFYVVDVIRKKVKAPRFAVDLREANEDFPGAPMLFIHGGGGEKGVADFLKEARVRMRLEAASKLGDKWTRAQKLAAAWNIDPDVEGDVPRVLVPRTTCFPECPHDCEEHDQPEWVDDFVDEFLDFTGSKTDTDDQIDAAVAAHRVLTGKRIVSETAAGG